MMTIVDKPGYFGVKRPRREQFYNDMFGETHWFEGWQIAGKVLCFDRAVELHDEAYYLYLKDHPEVVEYVLKFGNCYSSDPSNIQCGCQHDQQATPRHIQDISVRRALTKLGVWFSGPTERLLQIGSTTSEGYILHPGNVPFHRPELILPSPRGGPVPSWAKPQSVEAFWQSTKVIVVE